MRAPEAPCCDGSPCPRSSPHQSPIEPPRERRIGGASSLGRRASGSGRAPTTPAVRLRKYPTVGCPKQLACPAWREMRRARRDRALYSLGVLVTYPINYGLIRTD